MPIDLGTFRRLSNKTSRPENGPWKILDDELKKSIKKFVAHDARFPGKMGDFFFVSNTEILDSDQKRYDGRCPQRFIDTVKDCAQNGSSLKGANLDSFEKLKAYCGCQDDDLKAVLARLHLIRSPERRSYESVIAHDFLSQLPECADLKPYELNTLRDELIERVSKASSLTTDDSSRYWICNDQPNSLSPLIIAKKISVDGIRLVLQDRSLISPITLPSHLGASRLVGNSGDLSVLEKKFMHAGLTEQIETARSRTIAAERRLLELAGKLNAADFKRQSDQLVSVVKGVCDDSKLFTENLSPPFRANMYRRVLSELQDLANNRASMIYREPYECLVGIAGLLTEDCEVWWSEQFDLELMK